MATSIKKELTKKESEVLLQILETRFLKNLQRHNGLVWENIKDNLIKNNAKVWSLYQMETTGGEPDIVAYDLKTDSFTFMDCAIESPSGRRSLCYDIEGLKSRKDFKPENNAVNMATEIGIEMLTETDYKILQQLGNFDTKTSSWLQTPVAVRKLGGALFGDRRYNQVFIYHNGAQSFYAARGFRGKLNV